MNELFKDVNIVVENGNGSEIIEFLCNLGFSNGLNLVGDGKNGDFYHFNDDWITCHDCEELKNNVVMTLNNAKELLEQFKDLSERFRKAANRECVKNIDTMSIASPTTEEAVTNMLERAEPNGLVHEVVAMALEFVEDGYDISIACNNACDEWDV